MGSSIEASKSINSISYQQWNVLPATSWLAIAVIGSAVAGVIDFPRQWLRASIAGAIAGSGALIGLLL